MNLNIKNNIKKYENIAKTMDTNNVKEKTTSNDENISNISSITTTSEDSTQYKLIVGGSDGNKPIPSDDEIKSKIKDVLGHFMGLIFAIDNNRFVDKVKAYLENNPSTSLEDAIKKV